MRNLKEGLLREPGHNQVFDAMAEATNRATTELVKIGGDNKLIDELIETTREYDKFVFKFYLNRLIQYLE